MNDGNEETELGLQSDVSLSKVLHTVVGLTQY